MSLRALGHDILISGINAIYITGLLAQVHGKPFHAIKMTDKLY
jgi:hypothetical protein